MYNLIEYSDNYSETLGRLGQYYKDKPVLTDAGILDNFAGSSVCLSLNKK